MIRLFFFGLSGTGLNFQGCQICNFGEAVERRLFVKYYSKKHSRWVKEAANCQDADIAKLFNRLRVA
jgi:hypothetical protein